MRYAHFQPEYLGGAGSLLGEFWDGHQNGHLNYWVVEREWLSW